MFKISKQSKWDVEIISSQMTNDGLNSTPSIHFRLDLELIRNNESLSVKLNGFYVSPLSNSLFHFIDCDVENEVLRVIMDGRHVH